MLDTEAKVINCLKLLRDHYYLKSNSVVFPKQGKIYQELQFRH